MGTQKSQQVGHHLRDDHVREIDSSREHECDGKRGTACIVHLIGIFQFHLYVFSSLSIIHVIMVEYCLICYNYGTPVDIQDSLLSLRPGMMEHFLGCNYCAKADKFRK